MTSPPPPSDAAKPKRDEWMLQPPQNAASSRSAAATFVKPTPVAPESGLYFPRSTDSSSTADISTNNASSTGQKPAHIGDGGRAWNAKRIRNVYDEAKRTKRPISEVATERFDSIGQFVALEQSVFGRSKVRLETQTIEEMCKEERVLTSAASLHAADGHFDADVASKNPSSASLHSKSHKKFSREEAACRLCAKSDTFDSDHVISIRNHAFLAFSSSDVVCDGGQFVICPVEHVPSSLEASVEALEEIRNFKKCLMKLFAAEFNKGVLFVEHVHRLSSRRHCIIEAFALEADVFLQAKGAFKKALLEGDEEWSQHRKLYETAGRPLRNVLSRRLPFFHVEFALDEGFAHVIEDERRFERTLAKNLIGSLLQRQPWEWRGARPSIAAQQAFRRRWQPYDWTQAL